MSHEPGQNSTESDVQPVRALPDATGASEALVQQIAEALDEHLHVADRNLGQWRTEVTCACGETYVGGQHVGETPLHIARRFHEARAVLPLVEAQVAPLRDELRHRELHHFETDQEEADLRDELNRLAEVLAARNGEVDAAESALRQVREDLTALADEWDQWDAPLAAARLRAVLDSARLGAADTPPKGAGEAHVPTDPACRHHNEQRGKSCPVCVPPSEATGGCTCGAWEGSHCECPTAGGKVDTEPEAGCDNTTHVCSCGGSVAHGDDCNIWLNDDRPVDTAPESGEGR